VLSDMQSVGLDRRRRQERVRLTFDVCTPTRQFRLEDEFIFRTYTAPQFRRLLVRTPELEVVETYDFGYEMDHPIRVTSETEDVVFVLRKR